MRLKLTRPIPFGLAYGEALLGVVGSAIVVASAVAVLFSMSGLVTLGPANPDIGLWFIGLGTLPWLVILSALLLSDRGHVFLQGPAPSKRARLSAAELPNNLVVAGLVLAILAFVPIGDEVPSLTVTLIVALGAFLTAWAIGSSGRYRTSAFAVSEAMHWIGLIALSSSVLQLREVVESGAAFTLAALTAAVITFYSARMAVALWNSTEREQDRPA